MSECRNHVERPVEALCERCGDFLCGLCVVRVEGVDYCPTCVMRVRGDAVRFGPYVPWENRRRLGVVNAALQTISASFTRPKEFCERLPMEGGLSDPLLFAMLMRGLVVIAYGVAFVGFYLIVGLATREPAMFLQAGIQAGSMIMSVFQAALLLFVMAGILHLAVLVTAGGLGFERTFRVYGYGRAIDVLELIPILGLFASAVYRIYLHFLGLRRAHELSDNQAIGVALVPIALWFAFVVFAVGLAVVIALLVVAA